MTSPRAQGVPDLRGAPGAAGDPAAPGTAGAGRVGLFFCRCGSNLGEVVRLGELGDPRAWPGASDVATHDVLCSAEGTAWLAERIREKGLERVVVAACSPREHERTFRAVLAAEGRSPFHLQMANLREQVEWNGGDPGEATARARRLVRAALDRVALHRAIPVEEVEVSPDVLVVGAGPAGVSAALALAGRDRKVFLAEREHVVGGLANRLDELFPGLECASCLLEPALDRALHSDRIEVLTGAEPARVRGSEGRFEVELAIRPRGVDPAACLGCHDCEEACPVEVADRFGGGLATRRAIGLPYAGCLPHLPVLDPAACARSRGEACDLCARACKLGAVRLDEAPRARRVVVGAIVLATGMSPGEVRGPPGLVSSYQLERMLHPDGPTRGLVRDPGGREPRSVLLVAAGGGEDGELAAEEIGKLARRVRGKLPAAQVTIVAGGEAAARPSSRAAALAADGIELVPGEVEPGGIAAGGDGLEVPIRTGGAQAFRRADLVVIHAPARAAEGAGDLARLLRIDADERGFLRDRAAGPFEPTSTRIAGIHVAGAAAGPRTLPRAILDGKAAAALVLSALVPGEKRVLEPLAAEIDEGPCGGCGICASVCPFGAAIVETRPDGARKARVEPLHCRGCGTCAAACPTGAASARGFTTAQLAAEISALLRPAEAGPEVAAAARGAG